MIQTGGYKSKDSHQYGYNITDLFTGSYYSIGLLFDVVINCYRTNKDQRGKLFEVSLSDAG
jgi:hypothetical protein